MLRLSFINFTYIQLITYSVHIGHSLKNSVLYSSWIVYSYRQNVLLIDLLKHVHMLRVCLNVVWSFVRYGLPVWFINIDETFENFLEYSSKICGEFYIARFWLRGLLSNFFYVYKSFFRFFKMKSLIFNIKQKQFSLNFRYWLFSRNTWPGLLFISSIYNSYAALNEAYLMGIPAIGVLDTNANTSWLTIPLPGNDESFESLVFYNDLVSSAILYNKFRKLILWFSGVRKKKKILSFDDYLYCMSFSTNLQANLGSRLRNFKRALRFFYVNKGAVLNSAKDIYISSFYIDFNFCFASLDDLTSNREIDTTYFSFVRLKFKWLGQLVRFSKHWVFLRGFFRYLRKSLFVMPFFYYKKITFLRRRNINRFFRIKNKLKLFRYFMYNKVAAMRFPSFSLRFLFIMLVMARASFFNFSSKDLFLLPLICHKLSSLKVSKLFFSDVSKYCSNIVLRKGRHFISYKFRRPFAFHYGFYKLKGLPKLFDYMLIRELLTHSFESTRTFLDKGFLFAPKPYLEERQDKSLTINEVTLIRDVLNLSSVSKWGMSFGAVFPVNHLNYLRSSVLTFSIGFFWNDSILSLYRRFLEFVFFYFIYFAFAKEKGVYRRIPFFFHISLFKYADWLSSKISLLDLQVTRDILVFIKKNTLK